MDFNIEQKLLIFVMLQIIHSTLQTLQMLKVFPEPLSYRYKKLWSKQATFTSVYATFCWILHKSWELQHYIITINMTKKFIEW
jgi:hypothetical protein